MKSSILIAVVITVAGFSARSQTSHYISVRTTDNDTASFTLSGGAFKSYGCKAIDPTYWMSGSGHVATVTFAKPESYPSFRVWGMNDDDSASVLVNGERYPLTSTSASYGLKVVCGTSPGPDGVLFSEGNLVGANTPSEANFSYQDIHLKAVKVSTITVTGLKGAGWGFAGASVYRTGPDSVKKVLEQSEPEDATKEQGEAERERPE